MSITTLSPLSTACVRNICVPWLREKSTPFTNFNPFLCTSTFVGLYDKRAPDLSLSSKIVIEEVGSNINVVAAGSTATVVISPPTAANFPEM